MSKIDKRTSNLISIISIFSELPRIFYSINLNRINMEKTFNQIGDMTVCEIKKNRDHRMELKDITISELEAKLKTTSMPAEQLENYFHVILKQKLKFASGFDGKFTVLRIKKGRYFTKFVISSCNPKDNPHENIGLANAIAKYFSRNRETHHNLEMREDINTKHKFTVYKRDGKK